MTSSARSRIDRGMARPLAAHAAATQSEGSDHVGTDDEVGGRLSPETDHSPSLAERSLCRYTPEVGAVCGKAARTDLCGGREVTRVSYRDFGGANSSLRSAAWRHGRSRQARSSATACGASACSCRAWEGV